MTIKLLHFWHAVEWQSFGKFAHIKGPKSNNWVANSGFESDILKFGREIDETTRKSTHSATPANTVMALCRSQWHRVLEFFASDTQKSCVAMVTKGCINSMQSFLLQRTVVSRCSIGTGSAMTRRCHPNGKWFTMMTITASDINLTLFASLSTFCTRPMQRIRIFGVGVNIQAWSSRLVHSSQHVRLQRHHTCTPPP
jgi:hypothetical protein